jgi:uncharacterized protein (TIGR02217 family)
MSIIVFADVILPNSIISAGVRGKNIRLNSRVQTDSGVEAINIVWTKTLRQYELGTVPLSITNWQALEAIHEITEGGAYGFLLEDPKDNRAAGGVLAQVSAGVYQLYKRYTHSASARYKDRIITRPIAAGMVITVNGVALTAGQFTVDELTGQVSIPSAPAAASLAWSGRFLVPVHFLDDSIDWDMLVAGAADTRFIAGPTVILQEIRE